MCSQHAIETNAVNSAYQYVLAMQVLSACIAKSNNKKKAPAKPQTTATTAPEASLSSSSSAEEQSLTVVDEFAATVRMRVTGVHALGVLAQRFPGGKALFEGHVDTFLSSRYGTQVQVAAMFLSEFAYARARSVAAGEEVLALPQTLHDKLDAHMQTLDQPGFEYAESANLTTKWRQELEALLQMYQQV